MLDMYILSPNEKQFKTDLFDQNLKFWRIQILKTLVNISGRCSESGHGAPAVCGSPPAFAAVPVFIHRHRPLAHTHDHETRPIITENFRSYRLFFIATPQTI